jgi:hypothetical protein
VAWKSRFLSVWPYATTSTAVLFFTTAVFGSVTAWRLGAQEALSFVLAVFDPAIAAICLLFVCAVQPSVFSGARFRLPHAVSIPTVYVAIVFAIKTLSMDGGFSIQRLEGAGRLDLIWLRPGTLFGLWLALVAVFFLFGTRAKAEPDVE